MLIDFPFLGLECYQVSHIFVNIPPCILVIYSNHHKFRINYLQKERLVAV